MKNQSGTLEHSPVDNSVAYTPGPWQTNRKVRTLVEAVENGQGINIIAHCADLDNMRPRSEDEANAQLIAAAPDLLAASIAVVDRWDTPLWKDVLATAEFIGELRKAIHKATGK